jgi:ABC-type nitrate/sulfonate/bicarbonate transport system permease component
LLRLAVAAAGRDGVVWQLASSTGWLSTRILPSPEGVLKAFWTLSGQR